MPRHLFTSARVFPVIIAITLAIALLPERWLGWTSVPGEIVALPFGPFGDGLNRAGDWLRPPLSSGQAVSRDEYEQMLRENEDYKRMLFVAEARIDELQSRIQQLEGGGEILPS